MLKQRHILQAKQIDPDWLTQSLFPKIRDFKLQSQTESGRAELRNRLVGRKAIIFMAEPSTRTGNSFDTAAKNLGMETTYTQNALFSSSLRKGESFKHTIQALLCMGPDVIVIRHPDNEAGQKAALISESKPNPVPIFDAGSGSYEHPTQAMLDVFTIWEHRSGDLQNFRIAMGADILNSRTCRSLAYLLAKYPGIKIDFIAPKALWPPASLVEYLDEHKTTYTLNDSIESVLNRTDNAERPDYWYWGRLQIERVKWLIRKFLLRMAYRRFCIERQHVIRFKEGALLMHPLPIFAPRPEISEWVQDNYPYFYAEAQMTNGVYTRMAAFDSRLSGNSLYLT